MGRIYLRCISFTLNHSAGQSQFPINTEINALFIHRMFGCIYEGVICNFWDLNIKSPHRPV